MEEKPDLELSSSLVAIRTSVAWALWGARMQEKRLKIGDFTPLVHLEHVEKKLDDLFKRLAIDWTPPETPPVR